MLKSKDVPCGDIYGFWDKSMVSGTMKTGRRETHLRVVRGELGSTADSHLLATAYVARSKGGLLHSLSLKVLF